MKNNNYLRILEDKSEKYILENNLSLIIKFLKNSDNKKDTKKAILRAYTGYVGYDDDEDIIKNFLDENRSNIIDNISLYEEKYLYNKEELKEIYNKDYEDEIFVLLDRFNNWILNNCNDKPKEFYVIQAVFECLRSYVTEESEWVRYPYLREVVYLNNFSEEEQDKISYTDITIEDVVNIAKQFVFRFRLL